MSCKYKRITFTSVQVLAEFELIVGQSIIEKMNVNWKKYQGIISKVYNKPGITSLGAIQLLDKQFRTGPTSKHAAAYQIHEVIKQSCHVSPAP